MFKIRQNHTRGQFQLKIFETLNICCEMATVQEMLQHAHGNYKMFCLEPDELFVWRLTGWRGRSGIVNIRHRDATLQTWNCHLCASSAMRLRSCGTWLVGSACYRESGRDVIRCCKLAVSRCMRGTRSCVWTTIGLWIEREDYQLTTPTWIRWVSSYCFSSSIVRWHSQDVS